MAKPKRFDIAVLSFFGKIRLYFKNIHRYLTQYRVGSITVTPIGNISAVNDWRSERELHSQKVRFEARQSAIKKLADSQLSPQ